MHTMFNALENHDDLERTDDDTMSDTYREYETGDGFDITLTINQDSRNVLVKLWDNVEDNWKRRDEHLLARGNWIPVDQAEDVALDMYDGRHTLKEVQNKDVAESEPEAPA